ncbi:MAG TPA: PPC domain-containing protein, partial [Candidatus Thermoplasmatota archaeon]|nr:PPC domain-containing protein [Candidatus Thermoplasmatota archaeon]
MNRTILTIGIALLLLGAMPASAKTAPEAPATHIEKAPVTGVGTSNAECSLGAAPTALANNVSQSASLTNVAGASCEFTFAPIAGSSTTKVTLPATTPADFDLYVKRGSAPTTSSYDCRPYLGGSSIENCEVANNAQTVYIMILRFSGSGAFTLTALGYTPPPPPPTCSLGSGTTSLSSGVSVSASLSSATGANCQFSYAASPAADLAHVVLSGLAADFDLYVKVGSPPTTTSYDCRPYSGGLVNETCDVGTSGTVFVMVRRFSGSGAFTVTASDVIVPILENGVPVQGVSAPGSKTYYKLIVPEGSTLAAFGLVGDVSAAACYVQCLDIVDPSIGANDADLYVRLGSLPTLTSYGCRPWAIGSTEACAFSSDVYT